MKKKIRLDKLKVLVLDCQATGPSPETHHLLEIGWVNVDILKKNEKSPSLPVCFICKLPEGVRIPAAVIKLTGFSTDDLISGRSHAFIWEELQLISSKLCQLNNMEKCPTVIHFARYEKPFLSHLHQAYSKGTDFPLEVVCTHRITQRLLPYLPRKGLRAAAGFLGYSVPEWRRSNHHILATEFIWRQVIPLLKEEGITTWEQLKEWLDKPPPKSIPCEKKFPLNRSLRLGLPDKPGIYRMLRSNKDIIYIGKATSLKQRVNSYFHKKKPNNHSEKILEMLTQVKEIDFTLTESSLEAALMENDEIKKHSPPYNVALRGETRQVVFFSRDLLHSSKTPDKTFVLGPIVSRESLESISHLSQLIASKNLSKKNPDIPPMAMGISMEYAPQEACFYSGFKLFKKKHKKIFKKHKKVISSSPLQWVLELAKELQKLKIEEKELKRIIDAENSEEEEGPESVTTEEWVWTPEAVANSLEGLTRRAGLLIRQARWFCLLSESTLVWRQKGAMKNTRRVLILEKGLIKRQENISTNQKISFPTNSFIPFKERQASFDLMTYDRMRVLTTELRRLVLDKKITSLELYFNTRAVLNKESLGRAFLWI